MASLPRREQKKRSAHRKKQHRQEKRRQSARDAYEQLRKGTDRPELDAKTSRTITEYCTEILGSPDFQPWMRVYALYQGRFVEGWIPDDYFSMKVLPNLYSSRKPVADKRTLSKRLFKSEAFPDIAYFINDQWFTNDFQIIAPGELTNHIFCNTEEVYLKLENSIQGRGVSRVRRSGFIQAVHSLSENAVVQRPVVQHDWFDEIYPQAIATLRVTTSYLDSRGPQLRASYLRVGRAGRTHVESGKSLRWAVIDDRGSTAPEALDENWQPHAHHPDSGFVFRNSCIPFFSEAVATCLKLHARIPHDAIVGWDVGITKTGDVEVMEWNSGHTDIKFTEATVGPCFADCGFERFSHLD